ncbi:mitochondrial 2-oxoglutarate/malate carrier protein-like [Rhagoletis pomonella]|uniref:mitochondrial 2-oxoglutarate/malate carrier protein-like n=1 Tax=Rhagoletis pomonella TaxID=28610 RepID=UPI0017849A08|nr:mitochondrial 2-oxoglutarate/malate carrier protein-like [Rhagoletis pomonella]XP_036342365.1 mitochondrial 2-oxoglutarate/malate carrier protein-like [Rhagoletis pomonella]
MAQQQRKQQKPLDEKKDEAKIPTHLKFIFAGLSSMGAAAVVHPMDLAKTRMQIAASDGSKPPTTPLKVLKTAVKNDGFRGLYKGLSASLLRQAIYSTTRIGIYTTASEYYRNAYQIQPPLAMHVLIAFVSGAMGAYAGTPADVGLVRMMTDARLPPAERRNYTSTVNALTRIVKEEGVLTLWRGAVPTVGRAVVVNVAQLASYSQFRELAQSKLHVRHGLGLHLIASIGSGVLTATASLPVDIGKTRIQNMKVIDGKPEYSGLFDVIIQISKKEGVLSLWRGYIPYVLRVAPGTVVVFILLEQLNTAYFKYALGEEYKSTI